MPAPSAEAILDAAWSVGFRNFDTAEAYGCSAERLSHWLDRVGRMSDASIVTKIQCRNKAAVASESVTALNRFDGAAQRSLLAHGYTAGELWHTLCESAAAHDAEAGQSIYEAGELTALLEEPSVRRVQAPGNIFDDRARLARGDAPLRLDFRSAFLQGILLLPPAEADRRVNGGGALAGAVQSAAAEVAAPADMLLLAVMLRRLRANDRLVVGADNPLQVESCAAAPQLLQTNARSVEEFEALVIQGTSRPPEKQLLDPRMWTS